MTALAGRPLQTIERSRKPASRIFQGISWSVLGPNCGIAGTAICRDAKTSQHVASGVFTAFAVTLMGAFDRAMMCFCRGVVVYLALLWRAAVDERAAICDSNQGKRFTPIASHWPCTQFTISPCFAIAHTDFALTLAKKTPGFGGLIHRGRFGGVRYA